MKRSMTRSAAKRSSAERRPACPAPSQRARSVRERHQGGSEGMLVIRRDEGVRIRSPTTPGNPPLRLATTTVPRIIASATTRPNGSSQTDGTACTHAVSPARSSTSCDTCGRISTASASPSSLRSASRRPRSARHRSSLGARQGARAARGRTRAGARRALVRHEPAGEQHGRDIREWWPGLADWNRRGMMSSTTTPLSASRSLTASLMAMIAPNTSPHRRTIACCAMSGTQSWSGTHRRRQAIPARSRHGVRVGSIFVPVGHTYQYQTAWKTAGTPRITG